MLLAKRKEIEPIEVTINLREQTKKISQID